MPAFRGFIGPSYTGRSRLADCERSVCLYPERNDAPAARAEWSLLPTPGLLAYVSTAVGPGRGMFAQDGRAFAVQGAEFREVFFPASTTLRGGLVADNYSASMASSGDAGAEIAIASAGFV